MVCGLILAIATLDRAFHRHPPARQPVRACDGRVAAMAETAKDMKRKYKETSEAGLAVSVTLC
jgi:hypothetical protein